MSALRDLCLCMGIVINFNGDKNFVFENDLDKLKQQLSNLVGNQRNKNQNKKGKGRQNQDQQILDDVDLFVYENLPFSANDIADFYPILKSLPL